jgi:hypothetical protein
MVGNNPNILVDVDIGLPKLGVPEVNGVSGYLPYWA